MNQIEPTFANLQRILAGVRGNLLTNIKAAADIDLDLKQRDALGSLLVDIQSIAAMGALELMTEPTSPVFAEARNACTTTADLLALAIGDWVEKVGGDYTVQGEVRAIYSTHENGPVRVIVSIYPQGFQHIYSVKQLQRVPRPTAIEVNWRKLTVRVPEAQT